MQKGVRPKNDSSGTRGAFGDPDRTGRTPDQIFTEEKYLGTGGARRAVNYANYSKEGYNILTLKNYGNYYAQYQKNMPSFLRDQPDWSKSAYKKKNVKMDQTNYILFRNARNIKNITQRGIDRSKLYRSFAGSRRRSTGRSCIAETPGRADRKNETLPLIRYKEKRSHARTKCAEMTKRSLSSYCGKVKLKSSITKVKEPEVSAAEKLLQRAEQLGKFIEGMGTKTSQEMAKNYAQKILEKTEASDLAKEQAKIAIEKPPEKLEQIIEGALQIPADESKPQEDPNKTEEEKLKELESKILALFAELKQLQQKKKTDVSASIS